MGKLASRANMTIASVAGAGLGAVTVGALVGGYQTFTTAGILDGETISYVLQDGTNWEIGEGIWTASSTSFTRPAPQYSSAGVGVGAIITTTGTAFIDALTSDLSPNFMNINKQEVLFNYTLATGWNSHSVGPITVASGFAVTIPSGSVWVVI